MRTCTSPRKYIGPFSRVFVKRLLAMELPKIDPANATTTSDTKVQPVNPYVPLAHDAPVESPFDVHGVVWKKVR